MAYEWQAINITPDSANFVVVWIKLTETKTDSDGFEFTIHGHWEKGFYDYEHEKWYNEEGNHFRGEPTHWQDIKQTKNG